MQQCQACPCLSRSMQSTNRTYQWKINSQVNQDTWAQGGTLQVRSETWWKACRCPTSKVISQSTNSEQDLSLRYYDKIRLKTLRALNAWKRHLNSAWLYVGLAGHRAGHVAREVATSARQGEELLSSSDFSTSFYHRESVPTLIQSLCKKEMASMWHWHCCPTKCFVLQIE